MQHILVTGFSPFDGRDINASWVAASSVNRAGVDTLEIPVIWGEPMKILEAFCNNRCPDTIISLGEGREGWFDLETVALNKRQERKDNAATLPDGALINPNGPAVRKVRTELESIQRDLSLLGYPIRISSNAGQFLCEETLYVLEQIRESQQKLRQVLFCHLPPFGTTVHIKGESKKCDENVLADFVKTLLGKTNPVSH